MLGHNERFLAGGSDLLRAHDCFCRSLYPFFADNWNADGITRTYLFGGKIAISPVSGKTKGQQGHRDEEQSRRGRNRISVAPLLRLPMCTFIYFLLLGLWPVRFYPSPGKRSITLSAFKAILSELPASVVE